MKNIAMLALVAAAATVAVDTYAKPTQPPRPPDSQQTWTFRWSTGRGRLGAEVMSMTPELRTFFGAPTDAGVLVARVQAGSTADQMGLRAGDVIVSVDGTAVDRPTDVRQALAEQPAGTEVAVTIVRDRKVEQRRAKLPADRPGDDGAGTFPLQLPEMPGMPGFDFDGFDQHFRFPDLWTRPSPDDGHAAPDRRRQRSDSPALRKQLDETRRRLQELERRLRRLEQRAPGGSPNRT